MSGINRKGARRPTGYGPRNKTLQAFPPHEQWDSWKEYDVDAWPRKVAREYTLVPTVCFNCEAACGLTAFVDKETFEIRKLEGNPHHPGSRGRNCAKGPATINQINDPERILYPQRRTGPRGSGEWERVSWDHVLDTFAEKMHDAFAAGTPNDVLYFVGRPGEDGFADRFLETWGSDGHNSHTNVCSSGGRAGYGFWCRHRPPVARLRQRQVHAAASRRTSSPGHYFNPHAQRIVEAQQRGAKVAVMDPRLSNTASMADYWLPTWPGIGGAPSCWRSRRSCSTRGSTTASSCAAGSTGGPTSPTARRAASRPSRTSSSSCAREYDHYTPEFAEAESGLPAATVVQIAHEIAAAGAGVRVAHLARGGGRQPARLAGHPLRSCCSTR